MISNIVRNNDEYSYIVAMTSLHYIILPHKYIKTEMIRRPQEEQSVLMCIFGRS